MSGELTEADTWGTWDGWFHVGEELRAPGPAVLTTGFSPQVTVCWVDEAGPTHCLSPQAEHAGVRTYFFSAESPAEQEAWIQAMGEAARVQIPPAQKSAPPAVRPK